MKKEQLIGSMPAARNSSLELLRIIAMLFIVLSHVCVHSGFVAQAIPLSFNRFLVQWGVLGNLGVDIFVMLSGFFLCTKQKTATSLGKLFVQVWFYSILLFIVCKLGFGYSFSLKETLRVFIPTVFGEYWFFTAYIVLVLISPYINSFLATTCKSMIQKLLLIMVFLWVILPTFTRQQLYGTEIPQFVLLYIIGAYFRKYPGNWFQQRKIRLLVTICSFSLLFLSTIALELVGTKFSFFSKMGTIFYTRNSLLIIGCATGLFANAVYAKPFTNRFVNTVAGCTFGVYLIHDNPAVREVLWKRLLPNAQFLDSPLLILRILGSVASVFIICVGVEYLRQKMIARPMLYLYDKLAGFIFQGAKSCWAFIEGKLQITPKDE